MTEEEESLADAIFDFLATRASERPDERVPIADIEAAERVRKNRVAVPGSMSLSHWARKRLSDIVSVRSEGMRLRDAD